jgi:hypothetical protein
MGMIARIWGRRMKPASGNTGLEYFCISISGCLGMLAIQYRKKRLENDFAAQVLHATRRVH